MSRPSGVHAGKGSVVPKKDRKEKRDDRDDRDAQGHKHQDAQRKIENVAFTKYYKEIQGLCGTGEGKDEEWEKFMNLMRTPLPTTMWINDTDELAPEISEYLKSLEASNLVMPIPWYPIKGMGWRINADKKDMRKHSSPEMQKLRHFLIRQTAMGTISRQEEVSMIPTFLLDIQGTDKCLDMCASPGSKTAQMLVNLGRLKQVDFSNTDSPFPFEYLSEGFVMANELDFKRANMLVHQVKRMRLLFPFALFTNHDARWFPEIDEAADAVSNPSGDVAVAEPMRFDKILCDVVCSGDGTLRKAPYFFKTWSPREGMKLQKTQVQIALRAAHLLRIGGRMVYSTCSLNPIENEAVVSQIVKRTGGAMRVVDARSLLPDLQTNPGLTTWTVTNGKGNVVEKPDETYNEALFPVGDMPDFDLTKCMRLMPHHCNGGGFFVAVLDKVKEFRIVKRSDREEEGEATEKPEDNKDAKKEGSVAASEEGEKVNKAVKIPPQFVAAPATMTDAITNFYDIPDFPIDNLVCRTAVNERELKIGHNTTAAMVSNSVREVLRKKNDKMIVVSAGLRLLANEHLTGGWRIACESAPLFTKFMTKNNAKRILKLSIENIKEMIRGGKLKEIVIKEIEEPELKEKVESLETGAVLVIIDAPGSPDGHVATMAMRARSRLQLLVDAEDLVALQYRLNIPLDIATAKEEEGPEASKKKSEE